VAVERTFESLEAVIRDAAKASCGAETTSGSICRAAPMANGRCVQHGGRAQLARAPFGADESAARDRSPRSLSETIDRVNVGLDLVASLASELPLAARQQLVADVRVLAARAVGAYHDLLSKNRTEAAATASGLLRR